MIFRSTTARLIALMLAAAVPGHAQFTAENDPANLAGERVPAPDLADTLPIDHGAQALEQLLRKLRTRASFMLIVAHPDDEDGGMLTYLSRGQGARVAMLTLTRGEGGQNLMSADFEDALGLIRTQELLAADRYMGVDQFFGTEVDFGFSKTKEEAFRKWTHERVLYDAVRSVRLYRPLVIAAVFIGAPSDGHGQHQVSGQIAQEVFKAAGDPKVFPDQIAAGLEPWQPLKVYARIPFARIDEQGMFDSATNQYVQPQFTNYVTGKVSSKVPKANVVVPEGATDPLLGGLSYVQFARQGLSLQKSQVGRGGRSAPAGRFDVSYHRYGSAIGQPDGDEAGLETGFFDGIDTSLPGIASLAPEAAEKFRPLLRRLDDGLAKAQHEFDPSKPEAIAPVLRDCLSGLDSFVAELQNPAVNDLPRADTFNLLHELRIKRVQLNQALVLALGVGLKAEAPSDDIVEDTSVKAHVEITQSSAAPVTYKSLHITGAFVPDQEEIKLATLDPPSPGHPTALTPSIGPGVTSMVSRPYFFRENIEEPVYRLNAPGFRNSPMGSPALSCSLAVEYNGVPLTVKAMVGRDQQPAAVVPPFSVAIAPRLQIIPDGMERFAATVSISPPHEAALRIAEGGVKFESEDRQVEGSTIFHLRLPAGSRLPSVLEASAARTPEGDSESYRSVGYPGLVHTNFFTRAADRVLPVDVRTAPKLKVAYIPGSGDDVAVALEQLGLQPHILTGAELNADALKAYDAVVLGVRAYEAHPDLSAANPALLAYAQAGGVVLVQYVGRDLPAGAAPYPLSLGANEKVVEEDAPVQLIDPANPLLTWPNRISSADFNGWVEERGHGFMSSWDPQFTALTETHDQGQRPQRGGLLVSRTGRGVWIYLAYALYRQLPEGVPGAYRILANLISAGRNPQFQTTP